MLGVRMYPNGVDGGRGTHVALFVHMVRGEYDSILDWPFTGRISVSIMDQSGAECRNHISREIQATRQPGLVAFQQPAEAICRTGYGFVKFAPIGELFGPPYVKNDELFVKLEQHHPPKLTDDGPCQGGRQFSSKDWLSGPT